MAEAVEEFSGSVVVHVTQHMWPFDRGRCSVSQTAVVCRRRRSQWQLSRSDGPVQVTKVRLFPFIVKTVVWIEPPNRLGFSPFRSKALLRSLEEHGWPLQIRTVSWISWLPSRTRA